VKRHAPAAARNRAPLEAVLREELPAHGLMLEIASGTGEHVAHFARVFPHLEWQPSDREPEALASISAWREEALAEGAGGNLRPPLALDVRETPWPLAEAAGILCINMVHISPPEASEALMAGASGLLQAGAPLILYGPYLEDMIATAPTNLAFDRSLKALDPLYGLRATRWMDELALAHGLVRVRRVAMPANNLVLVYRRMQ
jgi:hypothetical protein